MQIDAHASFLLDVDCIRVFSMQFNKICALIKILCSSNEKVVQF